MNHDLKDYKDNPYILASIEREKELAVQEAMSNFILNQFKPKFVEVPDPINKGCTIKYKEIPQIIEK
jgi:hypothetical protein